MRIHITSKQMKVGKDTRDYVEKKVSKLDRYFDKLTDIQMILGIEAKTKKYLAEITGQGKNLQFSCKVTGEALLEVIDLVLATAQHKLSRFKEKKKDLGLANRRSAKQDKLEGRLLSPIEVTDQEE